MTLFDIALAKRFELNDELLLVDLDATDSFLICNAQTGLVLRLQIGTLAGFINSALSEAEVLEALSAPNGVAKLDTGGKVPAAQLPSYVDDVLEYATVSAFPISGEAGKIYVALSDNRTYRWGGSSYVEISPSPGSTDSLPEGSVNLYHTTARASAAAPVQSVAGRTGNVTLSKSDVGLSNVNNTSDADKPVSTAQQTALDGKLDKDGKPTLTSQTTSTAASAGTAGALPAEPVGYLTVSINGADRKLPFYD